MRRGLLALAALLILHGLAWYGVTRAMAVRFGAWVEERRAQGWLITHGPPRAVGWPGAAELRIPDVQVVAATAAGISAMMTAERLLLRIAPTRPDRLAVVAETGARLVLGEGAIPVAVARIEASIPLTAGLPPGRVEVLAEEVGADTPDGPLLLRRLDLALEPAPAGAASAPMLALRLRGEELSLPPLPQAPLVAALGRRVEEIGIDARLTHPPAQAASPARLARAWQEAGGVLELREAWLRSGPLEVQLTMTLALDAALQPRGEGVLRVAGGAEALAALAEAGLVSRGAARAAGGVLAMLSRASADGGPPRAELSVSVADGVIALARVPLLRHAPLRWP